MQIEGKPNAKTSFCLWDLKGRGIRKQMRNIVLDCIPSEKLATVPISELYALNRGFGAYLNVLEFTLYFAQACRSCRDGHFFWKASKETKDALRTRPRGDRGNYA